MTLDLTETPSFSGSPHPFERLLAFFEILLVGVSGYLFIPVLFVLSGVSQEQLLEDTRYLFAVMVLEASYTLLLIVLLLRVRGEAASSIGWSLSRPRKEFLIGLFAVPLLFCCTLLVGLVFRAFFPQYVSSTNPLLELIQTPTDLLFFVISSIYVGGIKEEVQRAFILVRFEKYLGGIAVGLAVWSLFFGYGHVIQGVDNAIGAGFLGLLFGLLFVWRRNLIAPILSHALFDITTLMVYWNFLRGAG